MTTNPNLGSLEKIEDLRTVWPNEAQDFTPWLAENISKLGDALGMELEADTPEASVGRFSLDLLASDIGSGSARPVVIENQLEETNHDHLGKLLTYAAGFDANVLVWIAKKFRDEHREALNLLNRRTGEDTNFFGVELELWKIDNSLPAVNFNVVATPDNWRRQTESTLQGENNNSERNDQYREFFQRLIDTLVERRFTGPRKTQPYSGFGFTSGTRGIAYRSDFRQNNIVRVALYIDRGDDGGAWNKKVFDQLQGNRDAIESNIGESLEWDYVEERRSCAIQITRPGSIGVAPEELEEIREWMVERLLKFKEVFVPRLAELVE